MQKICKSCGEFKEYSAKGMCKKCYHGKYYLQNIERAKRLAVKWQKDNPEKVKAVNKKYRTENAEKEKARLKKYHIENSEKMKIASKKWRDNNPGKIREIELRRRGYGTVEKGVANKLINENIARYGIITCEKDKKPCPDNFHVDHILPVSKGGNNSHDNLQILCAKCNQEKHTKIADYRQSIENNQLFLRE